MIEVSDAEGTAAKQPAPTGDGIKAAADEPLGNGQPGAEPVRNESVVTRLMRKGNAEVDALLEAAGMRAQLSGEAQDLARLMQRRLAELEWGSHAEAVDQLDIQRAFLAHRFVTPLREYERGFRGFSILDNFLNLTSILAGVGASLAAALNAPKVYAIVFGLIVGFLQSVSQWLKPSRRSTRRGLAAAALRSEAWAFLQRRDRYRQKDDRTAWALLCDQINRVEVREAAEQDRGITPAQSSRTAAAT
jgi:hypothetical protein